MTSNKEPKTFEQAVDQILGEMRATMIKKQFDYGPGNIAEFGELGVLVRTADKYNRLKNLLYAQGGEPRNESLDDTWLDLADYGLIALMVRRGTWGLPLEGTWGLPLEAAKLGEDGV
jgi:hypothetical protein